MHRLVVVFGGLKLAVALAAVCYLIASCRPSGDDILEEVSDRHYPIDPAGLAISVTNRDGSISIYGAGGDVREVRVETFKRAYHRERLNSFSVQVSA